MSIPPYNVSIRSAKRLTVSGQGMLRDGCFDEAGDDGGHLDALILDFSPRGVEEAHNRVLRGAIPRTQGNADFAGDMPGSDRLPS